MKKKSKPNFLDELPRHFTRYVWLFTRNAEYLYLVVIGVLVQAAYYKCVNPWFISFSFVECFTIGLLAAAREFRRVDRAFQSLPIKFDQAGYGKPYWILESVRPLKSDTIKVHAAGFSEKNFEDYRELLAVRLRTPVSEIRKPSPADPYIRVTVKRLEIPSHVSYPKLDIESLASGEFYLGQGENGLRKISLTKMIHMLVAGQTGAGKTQMLKQILTTLLVRTRNVHLSLIDMKGGIDFQEFHGLSNFEIVTKYEDADRMLGYLNWLYEKRTQIILAQKKENWSQVNTSKLKESAGKTGEPLGPVVLVVDELAELSRKATQSAAHSELQEKIAHLARLARVTGIHLILGTQRPDAAVLAGQSRDNLPTKVCYSLPSIPASSIVLGNMTAFTLGGHPGRAVVVAGGTTILQTPYITRAEVDQRLGPLREQAKGQKTTIRLARIHAEEKPATASETTSPGTEARPTRSPVDDFGVIHEK